MKSIRNFDLKILLLKNIALLVFFWELKRPFVAFTLSIASHCLFYLHNIFIFESLETLSMPVFLLILLSRRHCSIRDQTASHTSNSRQFTVVGKCQVSSDGAGVK